MSEANKDEIIRRLAGKLDKQVSLEVTRALQDRDVPGLFVWLNSHSCLEFVVDSKADLRALGMLEGMLVHAYTHAKIHRVSQLELEWVFSGCDGERLKALGDPLPGSGPFKVFRGVSGSRLARGLSWTSDLDMACKFACHYESGEPRVYSANVAAADVFFYSIGREESEFVVRPKWPRLLKLGEDEMQRRYRRASERIRQANQSVYGQTVIGV
jgi:hypothetical protein